jgi:hypothetical protein
MMEAICTPETSETIQHYITEGYYLHTCRCKNLKFHNKNIVFSCSGQIYSPHVLWIKIITLIFQTFLGQGPNTRRRVGALTTDHPTGKKNPFHQPDLTQNMRK